MILEKIVDFLYYAFELVFRFIDDIIYVVKLCKSVVANAATYLWFLPSAVSLIIITMLGIAVAYKIVGRR